MENYCPNIWLHTFALSYQLPFVLETSQDLNVWWLNNNQCCYESVWLWHVIIIFLTHGLDLSFFASFLYLNASSSFILFLYCGNVIPRCSLKTLTSFLYSSINNWESGPQGLWIFSSQAPRRCFVFFFECRKSMQHRWYTVVCEFKPFSKVLLMVKRNFLGFFSAGWSLTADGPLALKVYVFWRAQPRTPASVMAITS